MRITIRYAIALLILCLLLQELHEIAHLLADHLSVHCGTRYFLFWKMCPNGNTYTAAAIALAGPAINFGVLTIGFMLLSKQSAGKQRSMGFSLVMACIPLQRLQAIVFRGSDEILAFSNLMQPAEPFKGAAVIAGLSMMLIFVIPALYRAFINISSGNSWLVMTVFLMIPFIFNYLLQQLLAGEHSRNILASKAAPFLPSWLVVIDLALLILFLPFAKYIGQLFSPKPSS